MKGGIEYSKAIKKIVARVLALSMFVVSAGMTVGCAGSAGSAGAGTAATTATASAAAATTDAASVTAASAASATTDAEATTTAATTAAAKPAEQTEEVPAYEPFFRIDRDDPDAWQEDLDNVRFLTEGEYELEEFDEQEYAPEGSPPSVEGLDTLNISGSAEFSERQFRELAEKLRELADGKQICVIDARQESHMLVNGISLSWYGYNNWANAGLTLAEVEAAEKAVFEPLAGTAVKAYGVSDNEKINSLDLDVMSLMTEKELVESEGFSYYRLPSPDHSWPDETSVDEFIAFAQNIDPANTWLHFHCEAGKGRTGVYMAIYDMMKNPGVSFEDIMVRQAMTGSSYLPNERDYSPMADKYKLRAERIRQVYEYIQENHDAGYEVKWSEWIAQKEAE